MLTWMAESCSLASRSVTKAIKGFSSIVLLEYNTVDPQQRVFSPYKQLSSRHVKLLRYIPCDAHCKGQISCVMQIWCAFDLKLTSDYIRYFVQILLKLSLTLSFKMSFIYCFNFNRRIKCGEKVWFVLAQFIWGRGTVCKLSSLWTKSNCRKKSLLFYSNSFPNIITFDF